MCRVGTTCKNLNSEYRKNILWNPLIEINFKFESHSLRAVIPSQRIWEDFNNNNLERDIINYNNNIINNNNNYNCINNNDNNNNNYCNDNNINRQSNENKYKIYEEYKIKHIKKKLYQARISNIEKRRDWERNSQVSNQFSEQPAMFFLEGPDALPRYEPYVRAEFKKKIDVCIFF